MIVRINLAIDLLGIAPIRIILRAGENAQRIIRRQSWVADVVLVLLDDLLRRASHINIELNITCRRDVVQYDSFGVWN